MKVFNYFKAMAMMIAMMMSVSLVSCGDDDDEPEVKQDVKYEVAYKVSLSDDWFKFFDIEATYVDVNGKSHTVTVTSTYEYDEYIASDKVADAYSLVVNAKAKTPNVDVPEGTYSLGDYCYMYVYKYVDGVQSIVYRENPSKTTPYNADAIKTKQQTGVQICNYSCQISK